MAWVAEGGTTVADGGTAVCVADGKGVAVALSKQIKSKPLGTEIYSQSINRLPDCRLKPCISGVISTPSAKASKTKAKYCFFMFITSLVYTVIDTMTLRVLVKAEHGSAKWKLKERT